MPHSNHRWVDLASSVRCAESMRSSLSNWFCSRIATRTLPSRSEGGVGGLPRRPSVRLELEPAERESGPKGLREEIDALEDDGANDWCSDDENCLGGAKELSKY